MLNILKLVLMAGWLAVYPIWEPGKSLSEDKAAGMLSWPFIAIQCHD
jgi:hypothetical protein